MLFNYYAPYEIHTVALQYPGFICIKHIAAHEFDSRHVLGRENTKFPGWKYVHSPRIFHFNHTDGRGGKPAGGTAAKTLTRDNIYQAMEEFLRPWDLIVKGMKMMPLDHRLFGLLAENKYILENDKFSMRIYDGMGWEETKQVVRKSNKNDPFGLDFQALTDVPINPREIYRP